MTKSCIIVEIPEFPGYFAGNDGHISSDWGFGKQGRVPGRKRILVGSLDGRGKYLGACVKNASGIRITRNVHALIAEGFLGKRPVGCEVSHVDGNCTNNRPTNLIYESRRENHARKRIHGTDDRGCKNSRAKFTEKTVRQVRRARERGLTHAAIAARFSVSRTSISRILNKRRYAEVI